MLGHLSESKLRQTKKLYGASIGGGEMECNIEVTIASKAAVEPRGEVRASVS